MNGSLGWGRGEERAAGKQASSQAGRQADLRKKEELAGRLLL